MLVSDFLIRMSRARTGPAADADHGNHDGDHHGNHKVVASGGVHYQFTRRATSAREYGGRLPLPPTVRSLAHIHESRLAPVHALVDCLGEMPLAAWLDVGRLLIADEDGAALRSAAWRNLDHAIADQRLGVAAWYVRDAVETVAHLARHSAPRLSRSDHRLFAAAHGAADDATLATLARPHLARHDFEMLIAPFPASARS